MATQSLQKKRQIYEGMKSIQEHLQAAGNLDAVAVMCQNFLKDHNEGEEVLKVAELLIKLRPNECMSYVFYGVVNYNNKKYKLAEGAYLKAMSLDVSNGAAVLNLGNLYYKQGFLPEAERTFLQSVPLLASQNRRMAYLNLASVYADRKQNKEALRMLRKASADDIHDAALSYMVANIYFTLEKDSLAKKFYRRSIRANPNNEKSYLYLTKIDEKNGDFEQVKTDIKNAYDIVARQYGCDYRSWPQERDYYDIFYMYHLYSGDPQNDRQIFTNCNLDTKFTDNPSLIHSKLDDHRCVAQLKDMYLVGNGWTLFNTQKELYFNMSFSVNMILSHGNRDANFYKVDSRQGLSYTQNWDHVIPIDEPVIVMGGAKNYYHWLCDYLPRLALLDNQDKTLAKLPVLINNNLTSFQRESLNLLGFDMSRLREIDDEKIYHLQKNSYLLHLNNRPLLPHNMPDWMNPAFTVAEAQWLRQAFAPWMKPKKDNPKRLFLSRRNADFRKCLNEDKLLELVKQYGFEEVRNEELSFADQIALYSGAEAVMGVHGAGFANMVFAPEDATLIEIHAKGDLPEFYVNMTGILGQNHIPIEGKAIQSLRPLAYSFWNFEVDLDEVKATLDSYFG